MRRDAAIPEPFILPVSATITSSVIKRRGYDQVLELFSQPFMRRYAGAWRYPDLTDHVEYLADIVCETIEQEMRKEAGYLRRLRLARERVKQVIEGPDTDIDRIIRSVRDNGGKVSNGLAQEFPLLADEATAAELVAALQAVFPDPLR